MMLIIGDVHGKTLKYQEIIKGTDESVQLGDFGFKVAHDWVMGNVDTDKHKVLFGNHDYYPYIKYKHSITDTFFMDSTRSILYIRGAYSIDKALRVDGIDWFNNEELTFRDFYSIIDNITEWKPDTIISHDCPQLLYSMLGIQDKGSITSQGLQGCFESWQPKLWVFGHHHRSKTVKIERTKFVCLAELESYQLG